jgi:ArsR family transcriptional regulator, arsenate/arsenite/antimonite-responsive transcriptional repressor
MWQDGRMPSTPLPLLSEDWADCCTPSGAEGLDVETAQRLAAVLKVIAEPTRLRLLSLVAAHPGGEACICDLTDPVGLSQPTVSHHMKVLVEAGLLRREQRGKWAYFHLVPGALDALARLVSTVAR